MLILLCLLATAAVHRIWHYEDIFAFARTMLPLRPIVDPLWSGIWIAPLTCSLLLLPEDYGLFALTVLACYPPLRGLVWLHDRLNPPKVCTPCAKAAQQAASLVIEGLRDFEKRVILIGTDIEQANKLAQKHPTWLVFLTGAPQTPLMVANVRGLLLLNGQADILQIVFSGGNATLVLWNVSHQEQWVYFVERFGNMQGITWLHVRPASAVLTLPEHHRTVTPDEPMDHLL